MSPFVFVGGNPVLDFVNTTLALKGPVDLLETPADLMEWWGSAREMYPALPNLSGAITAHTLERAKGLRSVLRTELGHAIEHGNLSDALLFELNAILHEARPYVARERDRASVKLAADHPDQQLVVELARLAAHLAGSNEISRIHSCENSRCSVLFVDRTKNAARRWCSTLCFDQTRARKRRLRRASSA